ncbi:MAG: hypothetical protein GY757_56300, partial [bacterium]|nr:hypothetical protein [bacterium]
KLKHGFSKGSIGIMGPKDNSAYFSNFKYKKDDNLIFKKPGKTRPPTNMIKEWEISKVYKANLIDIAEMKYPRFSSIFNAEWRSVAPDADGLINISRFRKRSERGPDYVLARTVINAPEKKVIRLSFGYSDEVTLFLNGKKIFYGNSAYRYRDPSFVGVVGLHDSVFLSLEKGRNEIFLAVKETFGGWGFMCRVDREFSLPVKRHGRLEKAWETEPVFLTPESVIYDSKRNILYVSNFDSQFFKKKNEPEFSGYISKVKLNGEIEKLKWVTNLNAPCGMCIYKKYLYTVERGNLVQIDIESGKILKRYPVPDSQFLNDVVVDPTGNIYITDTFPAAHEKSCIHRFKDGKFELWLGGEEVNRSNGLFLHGDKLILGNSGDGNLKSIGLKDKRVKKITCLGAGVIDGIQVDNDGNYLVSHWRGLVYLASSDGALVELADTATAGLNCADFEFVKDKNLLVIPTYLGNKIVAYRLKKSSSWKE